MSRRDEFRRQEADDEARPLWMILGLDPPAEADLAPGPRAQTVAASAIAPARFEWLWPGRIPLGTLTLFSGDPKLGKSLAALSVLAALSRGGPLPGGGGEPAIAPRGSALLLSAEDDPARTIVPRLIAAGADLDRIHLLSAILEPEVFGYAAGPTEYRPACERMPTLSPEDLRAIERRAAELGDCRMIVFDPVSAYVGGPGLDVRRVLTPLRQMAERLGAAVLLITHHNKQGGSGTNGKYRVLGRIDYVAVCRVNFLFLQDPDDPTGRRRLMLANGGNLADSQPGLVYVIQGKGDSACVEWLPETIDLDADAALRRARTAGKAGTSVSVPVAANASNGCGDSSPRDRRRPKSASKPLQSRGSTVASSSGLGSPWPSDAFVRDSARVDAATGVCPTTSAPIRWPSTILRTILRTPKTWEVWEVWEVWKACETHRAVVGGCSPEGNLQRWAPPIPRRITGAP